MAYCNRCGHTNPEGSYYCHSCGATLTDQQYQPVYPAAPTTLPVGANVLAIISMVCGIVSCCTCFSGFVFSIASFITGAISRGQTPPDVDNPKARVGTITAIIGLVISVISLIVYIALVMEAVDSGYSYDYYYGY